MITKVALRNLFYDRVRFFATLIGVAFSVFLMGGQTAIYQGATKTITTIVDNSHADIWIMPVGSQSLEEALPLLTEADRQSALSTPGVESVTPLVTQFTIWQQTSGETNTIVLVGSEPGSNGPQPFEDAAPLLNMSSKDVVVDKLYLNTLGVTGKGSLGSIMDHRVSVGAVNQGFRSFTRAPYVFVKPDKAREYLSLPPRQSTFLLVDVDRSASIPQVQANLAKRLSNVEVLTQAEFRTRTLDRWLNQTGAGRALIIGSILGAVIGAAIIAQTMNMSVREHLTEFAILRAMGSTKRYVQGIVVTQVIAITIVGVAVALGLLCILAPISESSPLRLLVSAKQLTLVAVSTLIIGLLSSMSALRKVTKIDPAGLMK